MKMEIKLINCCIIFLSISLILICLKIHSINSKIKAIAKEQARTEIIQEHNQALRISAMKNKIKKEVTNDTRRKNN